jgi:hypothetical protein
MRTPYIVACVLLLSTLGVRAQETVAAARDLYTSANYEDALALLSTRQPDAPHVPATAPDSSELSCLRESVVKLE